jgi:hypothetical protein
MAEYGWPMPFGLVAVCGLTAIEVIIAAVAVTVALADFPERVAVMVASPGLTDVTWPLFGSVVATSTRSASEVVQFTSVVTLAVVPSE